MTALSNYWRTEYMADLSGELLSAWRDSAAECPIPEAQMGILHLGGALNERAEDDGATRATCSGRSACGSRGSPAPRRFRPGCAARGSASGRSRPARPASASRPPTRTTTVFALTITLREAPGGATELTLVHEQLDALPDVADNVGAGWESALAKLAAEMARWPTERARARSGSRP